MSRVVRAFLVWVMVIAMPVQGMAASTMMFCGPSHERVMQGLAIDAQAAVASQADAHRHDPAAAGHAAHVHAVPGGSAASDPSVDADDDGAIQVFQPHGESSCSACAACCSVLALPARFALPENLGPVHPVDMSPSAPVASHQPDALDRPPRAVLA